MLEAVVWSLAAAVAVIVIVAVVVLMRHHRVTAAAQQQATALRQQLRAQEDEARYLLTHRLPELVRSLQDPSAPVPGFKNPHLAATEYGHTLQEIMGVVQRSGAEALARADQSAQSALATTTRGLKSLVSEQQAEITAMQDRYNDPTIFADLMRLDHSNAQIGRRLQALMALCESWPGLQRGNVPVLDVVRGAVSRIRDYPRVRTTCQTGLALTGRVVEPVVVAIAELLDNAARHSPPENRVEVSVTTVPNGAVIVIDDQGIGMTEQDKRQAAQILSGAVPVSITRLGEPPKVGLRAVGQLARRYGFQVTVDSPSPYGGVRAVVFLPKPLLTHVAPDTAAPPSSARHDASATSEGGLPQRRRRTAMAPLASAASAAASVPATRSPEAAAAAVAAVQRGTRAGRAHPPAPLEETSLEGEQL
ncbi:ATP-binding protein [Streptosporangium sp. NPDC048047]|uniref:ATP-binding protein n=1 Tax=Streptosporangium sp. NPDC048047 TaxID=3155748 RepID=UPI0034175D0E